MKPANIVKLKCKLCSGEITKQNYKISNQTCMTCRKLERMEKIITEGLKKIDM